MFLELHILQNFAPSNLNRDDTGSPKDCEFGGVRRARISSQCLKRAIRTAFRERGLLPDAFLATRTRRLADQLVAQLANAGRLQDEARRIVEVALGGVGLKLDGGMTQYLLFLGDAEVRSIASLCDQHWDALAAVAEAEDEESAAEASAKQAKKAGKQAKKAAVPAEVREAFQGVLDGGCAADLALFGRMVADRPDKNVDAAAQVAHAISTHKVSMEFDFYTAVDDLNPKETAGAGMLGTVEFNSACFYRYANVDLAQLAENLRRDEVLARQALDAFLRASVAAVPTGKQNGMAAHNPPSFILAVLRHGALWNLANAFVRPVRTALDRDLVQDSILALDRYWGQLAALYGEDDIVGKWYAALDAGGIKHLGSQPAANLETLVGSVLGSARFDRA